MSEIRPQIRHCGRTVGGDLVAFDIQWDGAVTGQDVLWSMLVSSEDGAEEVRLVHRRAGDTAEQYVDDATSGRRQSVEADADVGEDEIVVRFPAEVVGVAIEWPVWKAVITVDGQDVATSVVPQG